MLITVYLYKDGVEIHKYNDRGNYITPKTPDVQRIRFSEKYLDDVRVILQRFATTSPKLNIIFHTEICSLRDLDTHGTY